MSSISDIKVNDDGTLCLVNGDLQKVYDSDCIRQLLMSNLRTVKGECFFDVNEGLDLKEVLASKATTAVVRKAAILDIIKNTYGITNVNSFTYTENAVDRSANIRFTATTMFNTTLNFNEAL